MTTLSNHVPDPRLITAIAKRRDGLLHRVNPWTKVGIGGALVIAVTVFDRFALLAGLYGAVLVVYGLGKLPFQRLAGWYTLPMLFIISVAGPLAFLEPGTPIGGALSTSLGELSVTWAGLVLFLELSFRSLTVVTFTLTASMTTEYSDIVYVLGRLLPRPLDQIALLTYRFTFVMLETLENLVKAAQSRGANFSEFWSNKRLYAKIFGMMMLSAIEQSERLVKSMEARGYNGDITLYGDVSTPPVHELVIVLGFYAVVVGYATFVVYGVGL
ncbi:cobalt ECF transporter T component CbiQ [Halocatena halophila]|uniref:cobalt ECF transporter T component CbiQ n=1 Tax=Halocatena halophila TaxID=2814576 RepID=UPI002ED3FE4B